MSSQHKNTSSKCDFVLKTWFQRLFKTFLVYKNKSESKMYILSFYKVEMDKGDSAESSRQSSFSYFEVLSQNRGNEKI